MMRVTSKGKFNTSFGTAYVTEMDNKLNVGDKIIIDDETIIVKKILFPTIPTHDNTVTIIGETA